MTARRRVYMMHDDVMFVVLITISQPGSRSLRQVVRSVEYEPCGDYLLSLFKLMCLSVIHVSCHRQTLTHLHRQTLKHTHGQTESQPDIN